MRSWLRGDAIVFAVTFVLCWQLLFAAVSRADGTDQSRASASLALAKAKREREATKAAKPAEVEFAARVNGKVLPPPGTVLKVTEYLMIDGKRIGVMEWTDKPVSAKAAGCPTCGSGCKCKDCDCDADSWNGNCAAVPSTIRTSYLRSLAPQPVFAEYARPFESIAHAPAVTGGSGIGSC